MVFGILKNSKYQNLNKCTIKEKNMMLKMIKKPICVYTVYIYIYYNVD